MTNQHPITPPLELVHQWVDMLSSRSDQAVFNLAVQWGADQELEACCKWLECNYNYPQANPLRVARRPKPPSLKEQALELAKPAGTAGAYVTFGPEELDTIRRALEALPND